MTTSPRHERYKYWLGRFLDTIAEELNKPIVPGGSMTFQREDIERGFEMDECYWIANEPAVRDKLSWDPAIDPPPDVAIEIEVSRSILNRLSILAAFKIPEVWCHDGTDLRINLLLADGNYQSGEAQPRVSDGAGQGVGAVSASCRKRFSQSAIIRPRLDSPADRINMISEAFMVATTNETASEHMVLRNISWPAFERILDDIGDTHHRVSYQDGDLEFMTISLEHDGFGRWIGRLIFLVALEMKLTLKTGGSTTLKRRRPKSRARTR